MAKSDFVRLNHMLESAQFSMSAVGRKSRQDLEKDKILSFAVIRALEVFGEAASQISKSFQEKHSDIPWRAIIGMRNRLIHAYFDVDYEIIWQAVTREIPEIIPKIEHMLLLAHNEN